jgi:hypothetical protein
LFSYLMNFDFGYANNPLRSEGEDPDPQTVSSTAPSL